MLKPDNMNGAPEDVAYVCELMAGHIPPGATSVEDLPESGRVLYMSMVSGLRSDGYGPKRVLGILDQIVRYGGDFEGANPHRLQVTDKSEELIEEMYEPKAA